MAGIGKVKVDIRQLKKFYKKLEKLESPDIFLRSYAQDLANALLAKAKKRTPVGRAPKLGRRTVKRKGTGGKPFEILTRGGVIWQKYWAGYVGGTLKNGWKVLPIRKEGNNYTVEVVNPEEYASYVEYGHRQKPGRYVPALGKSLKKGWVRGKLMMTISAQEIESAAPGVLEKKILRYLQSGGF